MGGLAGVTRHGRGCDTDRVAMVQPTSEPESPARFAAYLPRPPYVATRENVKTPSTLEITIVIVSPLTVISAVLSADPNLSLSPSSVALVSFNVME